MKKLIIVPEKPKTVSNYLAVTEKEKQLSMKEEFKGEVMDKPVKFPKELGAEHPFDFELIEQVLKKFGLIGGAVNKITDGIVGDFTVKADNENSQAIIDDFINTTNFLVVIRQWIKEGVAKGNGFIELDLENSKIRALNANNMFVKRNKKGKVKEYNQFTGSLKKFNLQVAKTITFTPSQIAHLPINKIPNDPYGLGIVSPNLITIENIAKDNMDLHKIMERKAGAPIHVKLGEKGESVQKTDIDDFKSLLQFMTNSTEWVTDANVEMIPLDFRGIGENLMNVKESDIEELAAGMEIPVVLLGKANVAEGLATTQAEGFQRKIISIQTQIEAIIEEKIFRPLLQAHDLDEKVEFVWNLPGEEEINKRLTTIGAQLTNQFLSPVLRASLEIEYARLLGLDEALDNLIEPSEAEAAAEIERKREEQIQQPEVPGAKPNANQKNDDLQGDLTAQNDVKEKKHKPKPKLIPENTLTEKESDEMTVREFVNIKEIAGFNYSDYILKILARLKIDDFEALAAQTEQDIANGLLPPEDIKRLRLVLRDGFRRNKTIKDIQIELDQSIDFKDRKIQKDGQTILVISAEKRPSNITRTETVRLANIGLVNLYEENKIEKVRWLSALSERTCVQCEGLNGQVFKVSELEIGVSQPPAHNMCRCSLISVVE